MNGDLSLPAHTHTHSITGIPRSRVCPHGPFSALSRHTSTRIFRGFAATPCLASGDVEDLSHGKSPWDALAARTSLPPPLSIPPSAAQDSAQKITPSAAITIGLSGRLRLAVTTLDFLSHSILAFLTISRLDHPRLTRSLSKTSSTS